MSSRSRPSDELPRCPNCGGDEFSRASLFAAGASRAPARGPTPASAEEHATLQRRARAQISEAGEYLAYEDGARGRVVPLTREWTRIGRSLAADVRFDDPTVSRRHALIVRQHDGVRVLDDRSLNGVFVNGERVEWQAAARRRRDRRRALPAALPRAGAHTAAGSAPGGQR